ncbi:phage tail tape measure protein [Ochrobactrum sp. MR28]|nr:phage tail tape measure protein [Ochrobactrum sp. MR28]MBX8816696.1 phage tail tape measure protein [Ochrobactrum sp. MR31]
MTDMKASLTLEFMEKGFEKAEKASKSLDMLAKASKKADGMQKARVRTDDRPARAAERAAKAEEKHGRAIHKSTDAMRRQKNEVAALERQQRRLSQTQDRMRLKASRHHVAGGGAAAAAGTAYGKYGIGAGAAMAGAGRLGLSAAAGLGLGVGVGAGAIAGAAVKGAAADEWERSQLRVLGDISEAQMNIHRKALDFTAMRRGVGTSGSYGVFGGLMAGGLSDTDASAMTDSVVIFAKATQASTEDAAKSTVALRNNMAITADKMMTAYDAIAQGGKAGQFEVADMARNLPSLLAKMSLLGETGETGVRNTVAIAQAVRKTVGSSDEAATNFENMLEKFTAKDFVANAKKVGINIEQTMINAKKKGISPVFAILQKIQQATKGNKFNISELLPDDKAQAAVTAILRDMPFVLNLIKEMENSSGTVMNDYTVATNNANEAWNRFSSNITGKAKNMAEVALPAVTAAMNKISEAMEAADADGRSYAEQMAKPKAKEKDFDQKDVSDETRNSWQGRNMEALLGITTGSETRSRNAYREYQQSRIDAPSVKKAEEKQRALQDRISNIIPAGRDFTDLDARDRSNPVEQGVLKKAITIGDIQKSLGGSTLGQTSSGALPVPTSRGAIMRASGMNGQHNLPQIEKAMIESGIKAKAAAENTASSIEHILGSMDTYAAGLKAGNQFASGLRASSGQAAAAANKVASSVAGHFPQSPAKVGPLRKLPLMGQKISAQLAGGMERRSPIKAAHKIASDIAQSGNLQTSGGAMAAGNTGGRGSLTVNLNGGITISGVSDPVAVGNHLGDSIRRRLDGVLGDVGNG